MTDSGWTRQIRRVEGCVHRACTAVLAVTVFLLLIVPAVAGQLVTGPMVTARGTQGQAAPSIDSVQWLRDDSRQWTLEQVRERTDWRRAPQATLFFGATSAAVWVRLDLNNPHATPIQQLLDLRSTQLDHVDWVQLSPQGRITAQGTLGDSKPIAWRPLPTRSLVLPIELDAGASQRVYLRLYSQDGWIDPITPCLMNPHEAWSRFQREDFAQALFVGAALLLAGFALQTLILTRLPAPGLYLAYLVCLSLFMLSVHGYDLHFATEAWAARHNQLVLLAAQASYLCGALFILIRLRVPGTARQGTVWFIRLLLLATLLGALLALAGKVTWAIYGSFSGLLLTVACCVLAFDRWRKGNTDAAYLAAGVLVVLAGIAAHYLSLFGLAGAPGGQPWAVQAGATVQMLLMAASVSSAMKRWRQERRKSAAELHATRERAAREVAQAQRHDRLTGLPNELALGDWLATRLRQRRSLAVIHLGLARFKACNEQYGRETGDRYLQHVTRVCGAVLEPLDYLARTDGDEFVLIRDRADRAASLEFADQLLERLASGPPEFAGGQLVEPRLGLAVFPDDARDAQELLARAALAMRQAADLAQPKQMYLPGTDGQRARRQALQRDLHLAAQRDELHLLFQPKMDLRSQEVNGAEALLRWQHPQYGAVSPGEFIPMAEQLGAMHSLTGWVTRQCVYQLGRWNVAGKRLSLSVNLSAQDLRDDAWPQTLMSHLSAHDVRPDQLTIEVTESAVMTDLVQARKVLLALRACGLELAMDDFGTGHSSLATLRGLPFQEIKIDKSFLDGMSEAHDSEDASVIVRTIIEMAHNLGMRVVAEGVESAAVCEKLRRWGCDHVQGYWLARPMPSNDLIHWLARRRHASGTSG